MIDIEEKILTKIDKLNTEKKQKIETELKYKGTIQKKNKTGLIEILNISDFETKIHDIIYNIIKNTVVKGLNIEIKELVCLNKEDILVFEGVMDATEENYFINNIIFRINDIKLIRIYNQDNKTCFCIPYEQKIKTFLYDTKDEYVSDIVI